MKDTIYRQDAIDELNYADDIGTIRSMLDVLDVLRTLPSAQPERKTGKWEYHSNPNIRGGMNPEDAYCSVCGFHIYTPEVDDFDDYNFCPNCGCEMER